MFHDDRQDERDSGSGRTEEGVVLLLDARVLDELRVVMGRGVVTGLCHHTADTDIEFHAHPLVVTSSDRQAEGIVHTEIDVFALVAAHLLLVVIVAAAGIDSERMTFELVGTCPFIFAVSSCKPIFSVDELAEHLTTVLVVLGKPPRVPVVGSDGNMSSDRNLDAEVESRNEKVGSAGKYHLALVSRFA